MLLLKLMYLNLNDLYSFVIYAIIIKLKYSFYFPAQKAFVELHFYFDKISKIWNIRKLYHFIHNLISIFGGVYNNKKEMTY